MSIMRTLTINGVTYDVVPVVPATTVTLLASAWEENGDVYSQVVEVPGATAYTKVDLQPTADQVAEFHYKVLAFVAENSNGVITVYAIGDKPEDDHTIQITKTEVEGTGAIRGNTVGTTMPRSNLEQEDPAKADYVLGRDTFLQSAVADALAQAKESGEFNGEDGAPGKDGTNIALCSYATGTLPKGRAKGDVNGDGIINIDDMYAIQAHSSGTTVITDSIALWAAECDGYVNAFAVVQYINKQYDRYSPYAADYYGNWQFDSANGHYYYDIAANGMTADCGCIIVPNVTFKGFKQAIPMSGAIRMCFKGCPTEEILCRILYSPELEGVTVENGVKNSFLDGKGGTPGVGIKAITIEEVGTVLISFTIKDKSYQAEEGMTWAQWCDSEYNTDGYYIDPDFDQPCIGEEYVCLPDNETSVHSTDVIAADGEYIWEY